MMNEWASERASEHLVAYVAALAVARLLGLTFFLSFQVYTRRAAAFIADCDLKPGRY